MHSRLCFCRLVARGLVSARQLVEGIAYVNFPIVDGGDQDAAIACKGILEGFTTP